MTRVNPAGEDVVLAYGGVSVWRVGLGILLVVMASGLGAVGPGVSSVVAASPCTYSPGTRSFSGDCYWDQNPASSVPCQVDYDQHRYGVGCNIYVNADDRPGRPVYPPPGCDTGPNGSFVCPPAYNGGFTPGQGLGCTYKDVVGRYICVPDEPQGLAGCTFNGATMIFSCPPQNCVENPTTGDWDCTMPSPSPSPSGVPGCESGANLVCNGDFSGTTRTNSPTIGQWGSNTAAVCANWSQAGYRPYEGGALLLGHRNPEYGGFQCPVDGQYTNSVTQFVTGSRLSGTTVDSVHISFDVRRFEIDGYTGPYVPILTVLINGNGQPDPYVSCSSPPLANGASYHMDCTYAQGNLGWRNGSSGDGYNSGTYVSVVIGGQTCDRAGCAVVVDNVYVYVGNPIASPSPSPSPSPSGGGIPPNCVANPTTNDWDCTGGGGTLPPNCVPQPDHCTNPHPHDGTFTCTWDSGTQSYTCEGPIPPGNPPGPYNNPSGSPDPQSSPCPSPSAGASPSPSPSPSASPQGRGCGGMGTVSDGGGPAGDCTIGAIVGLRSLGNAIVCAVEKVTAAVMGVAGAFARGLAVVLDVFRVIGAFLSAIWGGFSNPLSWLKWLIDYIAAIVQQLWSALGAPAAVDNTFAAYTAFMSIAFVQLTLRLLSAACWVAFGVWVVRQGGKLANG